MSNRQEQPRVDRLTASDATERTYEPPQLKLLGALHEMLMNKTDGGLDWVDNEPGDPRDKS